MHFILLPTPKALISDQSLFHVSPFPHVTFRKKALPRGHCRYQGSPAHLVNGQEGTGNIIPMKPSTGLLSWNIVFDVKYRKNSIFCTWVYFITSFVSERMFQKIHCKAIWDKRYVVSSPQTNTFTGLYHTKNMFLIQDFHLEFQMLLEVKAWGNLPMHFRKLEIFTLLSCFIRVFLFVSPGKGPHNSLHWALLQPERTFSLHPGLSLPKYTEETHSAAFLLHNTGFAQTTASI